MQEPRSARRWCGRGSHRAPGLAAAARATLLAIGVLSGGCGGDDATSASEDFVYENLIFRNVTSIPAAQSGELSSPSFSWPSTNEKHVVAAIFDRRISVRSNLITNPDNIVWLWHSGLGQGRDGNVLYRHGTAGQGGSLPDPLPAGTYYWAVWALDEQGLPVASSLEYTLIVL
jgi:hypothetical protein